MPTWTKTSAGSRGLADAATIDDDRWDVDRRSKAGPSATVASESADAESEPQARLRDRSTLDTLRDQAAQAAEQAKLTISAMAEEARVRIGEIIAEQKNAGADQVAGVARAAETAAGDLQQTNPHLARLVRSAAAGVDHVAEDIRGRDLAEVLASLSDFGRRRPVALFSGAVIAGFLLTRFLKSDDRVRPDRRTGAAPHDL